MKPAEDPAHEGNAPKYHTGKLCRVAGCERIAGTWWSPHWCQQHNAERLSRITRSLDKIIRKHKKRFPNF